MSDSSGHDNELSHLQQRLGQARKAGDRDAEIGILLALGELALEDAPEVALGHFRLAERVIRDFGKLDRLNEAIGGQGVSFRRGKRFDEAVERYKAAEEAAKDAGNRAAQVRWILRRASVVRTGGDLKGAKDIVQEAENLLRPPPTEEVTFMQFIGRVNFFDKKEVAALAELEGQIGLNLIGEGDEQGAEDHYRSALHFAEVAEDWDAVSTWATNVGNACTRRTRYTQAVDSYERALTAAMRLGKMAALQNTARALADCMSQAYRHEEAGDRLVRLATAVSEKRSRVAILNQAMILFDEGLCVEKAIDTCRRIESLVAGESVRPEFLAQVRSVREKMQSFAGRPALTKGPPALDEFLPEYMSRSVKSGQVDRALQAAHLVCDVRLALALAGGGQWKRLVGGDILASAGMDLSVVFDTLRMLLEAEKTDEALDLIQRFKAPAFCVPTLLRLQAAGASGAEVGAYLAAVRELGERVSELAGPAQPDMLRSINAVRRAGERMREAGESLRDVDPGLLFRMGGPARREELIDALPYAGGVGIVDFFVGREATLGIVLGREKSGVGAMPFITPSFNSAHVQRLVKLYAEAKVPKQIGGAQTEALTEIGKILHDNMFCKLAQTLGRRGISQLILIPDVLTRNLPLHLSLACGEEFEIPGIDTKDANYLCEVMPVEYAPCLQAVAASQVYLRPRVISRVAAFADPNGDLPGVRASMQEFGKRANTPGVFDIKFGEQATKEALESDMKTADVLMLGTHGVFTPDDLRGTHLVMHGEPWTVGDVALMPELEKRALLVLVACEVGAVAATPDDRNAWGMPGALLAAGSSAVLANMWPVEDVSSTLLLERFLYHLAHRGYRPAAAWFRAVQDLRRMDRDEVLAQCRRYLETLRKSGAPGRVMVGARSILEWVEDSDLERPFAHPYFWGATAVFGSGWHLPAGGVVAPVDVGIENQLRLAEADELVMHWKPRKALELAKQVAASADGAVRGRAYAIMALAELRLADISSERRVRVTAARLLKAAERLASNEGDQDLLKLSHWVREQMEDEHVDKKDQ